MLSFLSLHFNFYHARSLIFFLFAFVVLSQNISCKKFVEIPPPTTSLVTSTVYESEPTAISAVLGIYSVMMQDRSFASLNTSLYPGLSADELVDYSNTPGQREFYVNTISPSNSNNASLWSNAYQYIYAANAVIEGLSLSKSISASVKTELSAEAKFTRAFCYFYLVNLYGNVPMIVSTDYNANAMKARNQKSDIYTMIIEDLENAEQGLPFAYIDANNLTTVERVRPNKSCADALLARVYLYLGNWAGAEAHASAVINENDFYQLNSDLNAVFLKNSMEAIWQLQPVNPSVDTYEGNIFILTEAPSGTFGTALSTQLLSAFEPGDLRRAAWVDSIVSSGETFYYPFKYKIASADPTFPEYSMVLRLAEQYLIRAESRLEQNNLAGASDDLNMIRNRAGLASFIPSDAPSLRKAILHERQTELFTEWGHRWLDLKRTGTINDQLSPVKPNWVPSDTLYPVPLTEIKNDPNISQNPGY